MRMSMSGVPISAPEGGMAEAALLEAARLYDEGAQGEAAALWRDRAEPAVRAEWPQALADALCHGLALVRDLIAGAPAVPAGERAVAAWDAVRPWLDASELPLAGGRSTPAHFRKHKQDPEIYRAVALAEHFRLADAGLAVALNNHALALAGVGRDEEALTLLREAASLRRVAFGWREAGLGAILANLATMEAAEAAPPDDPVPVGVDRFVALARGRSALRRHLLASAELVPILRRGAG
jgi:hypothetical protein